MPLATDITSLRDQTVAELAAAHDYYGDTIIAWKLVQDLIDGGHQLVTTNSVTGTHTNQSELSTRSY